MPVSDAPDHRTLVHDLRMRVLDGEDIHAEEMFLLIDQIRQGRRSAGAPPSRAKKGSKAAKGTKAAAAPVDLNSILDQEL